MQITFNVVSYHRNTPGQISEKIFTQNGGSIGRAPNCDWILPDPNRYLSSVHAEVQCQQDQFYLIDHSTNGTFINKSSSPLGRNTRVLLNDGDTVEMGDFVFSILLDVDQGATVKPVSAETPVIAVPSIEASVQARAEINDPASDADAAIARIMQQDDNRAEPIPELLPAQSAGKNLLPDDWNLSLSGQHASPFASEAPTNPPVEKPDSTATTRADSPIEKKPKPAHAKPTMGPRDAQIYESFLQGLGVSANAIPEQDPATVMATAGEMLRICIGGYLDLLKNRANVKSEIRADHTMIGSANNNPLKFSVNTDDAIFNLLSSSRPGFMPAIDAIKDSVADVAGHEAGLLAGIGAMNQAVLDYFDPNSCLAEDTPRVLERLLPHQKEMRAWKTYAARYEKLLATQQDGGKMLFESSFTHAYGDVKKQRGI